MSVLYSCSRQASARRVTLDLLQTRGCVGVPNTRFRVVIVVVEVVADRHNQFRDLAEYTAAEPWLEGRGAARGLALGSGSFHRRSITGPAGLRCPNDSPPISWRTGDRCLILAVPLPLILVNRLTGPVVHQLRSGRDLGAADLLFM
jgi:hypothetical protein